MLQNHTHTPANQKWVNPVSMVTDNDLQIYFILHSSHIQLIKRSWATFLLPSEKLNIEDFRKFPENFFYPEVFIPISMLLWRGREGFPVNLINIWGNEERVSVPQEQLRVLHLCTSVAAASSETELLYFSFLKFFGAWDRVKHFRAWRWRNQTNTAGGRKA